MLYALYNNNIVNLAHLLPSPYPNTRVLETTVKHYLEFEKTIPHESF